jgi:LysR family glycine cleavage system transcriptional activator
MGKMRSVDETTQKAERLDLPPFATLRAFDAVGRFGGIRKAAQFLSIDHTVVSRHIRALETWLNVELYDRSNSTLTKAGGQYHMKVAAALLDLAVATKETSKWPAGELKISAIPGFGVNWLVRRLADFRSEHPDVDLEFRPSDDVPDLLRQEVDVDIRWVPDSLHLRLPKGVSSVVLGRPRAFCVASPDYLDRIQPVEAVDDLLQTKLIHEQNTDQWRLWLTAHGQKVTSELIGPRMWQAHAALQAARGGEGIALTNHFLVGDDLITGRLVAVGPRGNEGFPIEIGAYQFLAPETRWQQRPVALLRAWLLREMKAP